MEGRCCPQVMSCLPAGLKGGTQNGWELPFLLVGCVSASGHGTEGVSTPSNMQTNYTHTRTRTYTCLSILATAEGMPTHQPACVPARWGREAWVETNRDNQCALSCLSCSFMLSLSMCSPGAGVCVRHACCLIRGKFHVTFRWRCVKGCFGV